MRLAAAIAFVQLLNAMFMFGQTGDVDGYVRKVMAERHIPGLSLAVVKGGKVVKSGNYGLANVELNVAVNERTSFEIASMSKMFTDAGILLLVEEGKVGLDDSITKYIAGLPSTWNDITIRELMIHTSGLRDDWDEGNDYFLSKTSNVDFLEALKASPLKFKPGTQHSYGCGPFVLGLVIEKVSGKTYAAFMRDRIFEPLNMSRTAVNDDRAVVADRASGYTADGAVLKNGVRISPAAEARADVGIHTTALDLAKWDAAITDAKLLKRASWELMFTPGKLNDGTKIPAGFGWFAAPTRGDFWLHGGAFRTGYTSMIGRRADGGLTVIVLTNARPSGASEIAGRIAAMYDPNYLPVAEMQTERDPKPARTERLMAFLISLAAGKRPSEEAAADFPFALISPDVAAELEIGNMRSLDFVRCRDISRLPTRYFPVQPKETCFYRLRSERDHSLAFVFNADGRIAYMEPYEN